MLMIISIVWIICISIVCTCWLLVITTIITCQLQQIINKEAAQACKENFGCSTLLSQVNFHSKIFSARRNILHFLSCSLTPPSLNKCILLKFWTSPTFKRRENMLKDIISGKDGRAEIVFGMSSLYKVFFKTLQHILLDSFCSRRTSKVMWRDFEAKLLDIICLI